MPTHCTGYLRLPFAALIAAGCTGQIGADAELTRDDAHVLAVTLEGDALTAELTDSPVREAPTPFVRLGLRFDAPETTTIEISTSMDGEDWSIWQPVDLLSVEVETMTSMVGSYQVPDQGEAVFYQLRGSSEVAPTFLHMEFLEHELSETAEQGERGGDDIGKSTQALTVGGVAVQSRSSWGAKPPKCTSNHSPSRITIHHTVTPTIDSMSPEARLRQIQSYHQNVRGWCDIGYQYLVSRDGRLWEGRGATRIGSHVAGQNTGNVGISVMGTYTSDQPTSTQIDEIANLIRGLHDQYGIAIGQSTIKGHRNYGSTSCPGDALYAQLGAIRSLAAADQSAPPPSDPPPAQTGTATLVGVIYQGQSSSNRIAGATVELSSGHTATSDEDGYYRIESLPAGPVTITASKPGHSTRSITRTLSSSTTTWGSVSL